MKNEFSVIKKNKRLYIVDENQKDVYTPPDFIRPLIKSRSELDELALKFASTKSIINEIVEFESKYSPK